MAEPKKYRHKSTGVEMWAVQYGLPGKLMGDSTSGIASFLLGVDTDTRVVIENERMLDVVVPIPSRWDVSRGIADIFCLDLGSKEKFSLELGDWLGRHNDGTLVKISGSKFEKSYTQVAASREELEMEELVTLIYSSFPYLEGEIYMAMARRTAKDVIAAGWSRQGSS